LAFFFHFVAEQGCAVLLPAFSLYSIAGSSPIRLMINRAGHTVMLLPTLNDAERYALFFDFDGTLADIVEHPEDVEVTEATKETLGALLRASGGAVAIITGRDISTIDRFLAPVRLPVAGVHGLTRRDANGQFHSPHYDAAVLGAIETALEPLVEREPGLLMERKQGALALHYRQRPELEEICLARMQQAAALTPTVVLRHGKMVVEAVAYPSNKGAAIDSFLHETPFIDRIPVFAGDDLTDEDGFALVNEQQGISIKVGPGDTLAQYRVSARQDLLAWLHTSFRI
jgi:trehalose 6-phosphate phosphatase